MTSTPTPRRLVPHALFRIAALLPAVLLWLPAAAPAQTFASCELLKQQLATRIPPEIRGYSMDDVPAKTPLPPGGKVIGNCEGGARKVVYRRFGGPPLTGEGTAATAPVAKVTPASAPATAAPKAAVAAASVPGPRPVASAVAAKPAASPAAATKPAPAVAPAKPAASEVVAKPATPAAPAKATAPAAVAAVATAATVAIAPTTASEAPLAPVAVSRVFDQPATASPRPITQAAAAAAPAETQAADDDGFLARHGRWLWGLLALPLLALSWAWVSHRMAYDEAGLPRGPRL